MRWLIDYIRSCFCKHEWECIAKEVPVVVNSSGNVAYKWLYVCKKCMKRKEIILNNNRY